MEAGGIQIQNEIGVRSGKVRWGVARCGSVRFDQV